MNRQRKLRIITLVSTVLGVGAVSGAVTSTILYLTKNDNKNIYIEKDGEHIAVSKKLAGDDRELKVEIYKGETFAKKTALDEAHLQTLADKMNSFRYMGPEFNKIKRIGINDDRLIGKKENGVYYPSSFEIGLNTFGIENAIKSALKRLNLQLDLSNSDYYPSEIQDIIVDFLSEIFYHEYGHHIMYSYGSNSFRDIHNNSGIYETLESGSREETNFNKAFVDEFKKIFSYDNPSSNENFGSFISDRLPVPIEEYATISDLYNYSNGNVDKLSNLEDQTYIFAGRERNEEGSVLPPGREVATAESLKYLYSIDELLTRKMLLSSMPATKMNIDMTNGDALFKLVQGDGFWTEDDELKVRLYTNITEDLAKYTYPYLIDGGKLKLNSDYISRRFFDDDPFLNDNAKKYMELISKSSGYMQGFNLTYISHFSDFRVMADQGTAYSDNNPNDINKIIFGGYINKSNKREYVGYMDGEIIKEISPIEFNDGDGVNGLGFSYKDKLFSDVNHSNLIRNDLGYWVTKHYTDANNYNDKALYFFDKDENGNIINAIPLKTFRGQIEDYHNITPTEKIAGIASSYEKNDPYQINKSNLYAWNAASKGDGVSINKVNF